MIPDPLSLLLALSGVFLASREPGRGGARFAAGVGLGLIVALYRRRVPLNVDELRGLRGFSPVEVGSRVGRAILDQAPAWLDCEVRNPVDCGGHTFFIGEVVDVTGWLGGYNFQWAWASGHAAGNALLS